MKRLVIVCICVLVVALSGCSTQTGQSGQTNSSSAPKVTTSQDPAGIVQDALVARWDYMDSNKEELPWSDFSRSEKLTQIEYDNASMLRSIAISDEETKKLSEDYLAALERELELYKKYGKDPYTLDYNQLVCRKQRHDALIALNDKLGFEFSDEYKTEHWDKVLTTREFDNLKPDAKLVDKAFTVHEGKAETSGSKYIKCSFKVTNNTDYNYPLFVVTFRTKDSEGTVLNSEVYSRAEHFEGGSTAMATTTTEAAGCVVVEGYGVAAGHEANQIYTTQQLEEPVVLNVEAGEASSSVQQTSEASSSSTPQPASEQGKASSSNQSSKPSSGANQVPAEYKSALNKAQQYNDRMHMSKARLYDQLTSEYGEKFSAEAGQYAVDNVKADWNANALATAKDYQQRMDMSPAAIYDQLTSEYGEKFTAEEAQYAVDNL